MLPRGFINSREEPYNTVISRPIINKMKKCSSDQGKEDSHNCITFQSIQNITPLAVYGRERKLCRKRSTSYQKLKCPIGLPRKFLFRYRRGIINLFCLDEERNMMVGAVNIRHYLNEALLLNDDHIGDGVRPSERRKGIATKMISLALDECKKLGIQKVLMVCDKNNIGSAKSILNNGSVLENEVIVDDVVEQIYWMEIF